MSRRASPRQREALRELRRVLGDANVITASRELRAAEQATFATSQEIPAILRPANRTQVQACMRVANRHGVAVWPVSRGRNWGYGSRVPVESGSVLLDLGRMSRIVKLDEEMAFATVEPGVTFGQLHAALERRRSRLMVNVTGSTPDSSVLANALERGIGAGPYCERANHVCNLEVVLPDGAFIRTGFGRFPGSPLAELHRWGVGPSLDGLFAQSNLGVVTRMTLWLTPLPSHFQLFFFTLGSSGELGALVERARELYLRGYLVNPLRIVNDYRTVGARIQFPWGEIGKPPLRRAAFRDARVPRWRGTGSVFFRSPAERDAGSGITRSFLEGLTGSIELVDDVVDGAREMILTAPAGMDIRNMYFRKKTPVPAEPHLDRDRCGVIWFSPLVPTRASDVRRAVALVERIVLGHGLEPMMSLVMNGPRLAYLTVPLVFDRDVAGEDERAIRCHAALERAMASNGYLPYRLSTLSVERADASDPAYADALGRLKRALDPNGVLAAGRYIRRQPAR